MSSVYKNITGSSATAIGSINIKSMTLANVHATDAVKVDLYITSFTREPITRGLPLNNDWTPIAPGETSTYYLFKGITIPYGVTLILNKEDIAFDNGLYNLFIKLDQGDSAVDISVKEDNNNNNNNNNNNKFNQY